MGVEVYLSSILRASVPGYKPEAGLVLEPWTPGTVRDVALGLSLPVEAVKISLVNGRRVKLDAPVSDGDRVSLFPAIGGG
ncbi:MAG: MoaD/ThiS family protein [Deltaproteobacteria bacterium]|jgi:molybdopterin converting factor small subunit|nr:MoaD/ThiS family protein [Deltaproteobacteria bacterium]